MKKYIMLIFLCISLILTASCGESANNNSTENAANANKSNNNETANLDSNPVETAVKNEDIFGAISEIIGNMATINLAVLPETGMPVPMNRPMFNADNFDPDNLPEGVIVNEDGSVSVDREMMRERMGEDGRTVNFGEVMPGGFDPNNMPEGAMPRRVDGEDGFSRRIDSEDGVPSGAMRNGMGSIMLDYTGEEKEFILPVGLPIYALTRDDDGNDVETEIEMTDIQTGNVISVTYREDGKTIDKIIISQITAMKPSEVEEMKERISEMENRINNNNDNIDNNESGDEE